MQFKFTFIAFAGVLAFFTTQAFAAEVLTAPRVYHTVIKQSPYLVERTTTVTWTQSTTITETATPTPIPDTVGSA
ncbi:hypothetical protein EST38_g1522 [Candolleomyces aberdarensis]|uniref:Uncharacterized protein n=1 Tax=Candolleomyces aberdarensis TaxID=2316362 RepID=A0A4Q2DVU6_9AGAR|nr:hypothetical protein EST38_g1522 [Candolleomyces aberdarensis]